VYYVVVIQMSQDLSFQFPGALFPFLPLDPVACALQDDAQELPTSGTVDGGVAERAGKEWNFFCIGTRTGRGPSRVG